MTDRVFIHVGLPKTGTSYLQSTLWRSQPGLSEQGVAVPGERHQFQRRAVWDLMGRRLADDSHVAGSWRALIEEIRSTPEPTVILSEEFLVHASRRQIRRVVADLAPAEVHIIVTVRDLTRAIGSMWQYEVSQGSTWPWAEFVTSVRDPDQGPPTAGVGFWLRYDLRRLLSAWEDSIPGHRISVVIVPPEGAPPRLLLERFATSVGVKAELLTTPSVQLNTSVGVAETEVLRRVNEGLGGRLNDRQRLRVFGRAVKPALRSRNSSTQLKMPDAVRAWLVEYSEEITGFLRTSPYNVVGDLNDLRPQPEAFEGADPAEVKDAELLAAALVGLTGTIDHYATYWWQMRHRKEPDDVDARTRIVSSTRALWFKIRAQAFDLADENKRVAKVARSYLRRRSKY